MNQEYKDQLNLASSKIRSDFHGVTTKVQNLLNEEIKVGNYLGAKVTVEPLKDKADDYKYIFRIAVSPSFPVNMKEFTYLYGLSKLSE